MGWFEDKSEDRKMTDMLVSVIESTKVILCEALGKENTLVEFECFTIVIQTHEIFVRLPFQYKLGYAYHNMVCNAIARNWAKVKIETEA